MWSSQGSGQSRRQKTGGLHGPHKGRGNTQPHSTLYCLSLLEPGSLRSHCISLYYLLVG